MTAPNPLGIRLAAVLAHTGSQRRIIARAMLPIPTKTIAGGC